MMSGPSQPAAGAALDDSAADQSRPVRSGAGRTMRRSFRRALRYRSAAFSRPPEEPIRGELFSVERLEQHAESLAIAQRVSPRAGTRRRLASRLRDNGRVAPLLS